MLSPKPAEQSQIDYIRMLRSELGENAANEDVLDMTKQEAYLEIDNLLFRKGVLLH